jgi:NAD(P)-dependent dehydrogenase (short-subunit alcohol dehydrogenase family)/acyl dehydratase
VTTVSASPPPRLRFTAADLQAFARVSGDRNPLHTSASYARRTPWGEPVVFGVLAALRCLALGPARHGDELASLTVEFHGPVFTGTDYLVQVVGADVDTLTASVLDGRRTLVKLAARYRRRRPAPLAAEMPVADRRAEAVDRGADELRPGLTVDGVVAPDPALLAAFTRDLGLDARGVPAWQVAAITAQSYVVGMELPGRRALFRALSLELGGDAPAAEAVRFIARVERFDPRFSLATLSVELRAMDPADAPVARAEVSVHVRAVIPPPDPARMAAALPSSSRLAGRVALVVGASRGLGAAITHALLSQGCTVLGNFRDSEAEMEALAADARGLPGRLLPCRGDAASPEFCASLRARIEAEHGGLDVLVCNASPPVHHLGVESATVERMRAFVHESLALVAVPLAHLLEPIEARRGHVVFVSSSFVTDPPRGWAHYVAAKGAIEGLARALAAEARHADVLVYRPPRLLTDLTNTPLGPPATLSPEAVAIRLVHDLGAGEPTGGRLRVIDRFEPDQGSA